MEKTDSAVLAQLEENYEQACNAWVMELERMWEIDGREGHWIGDEAGGVYDLVGEMQLGLQDIKYIVRNGITYDQASDWQEYVSWISDYEEYGYETPTLREYVEYLVPLLDEDARERIDKARARLELLKDDLVRLCKEELGHAQTQFTDQRNMKRHVEE